MGPRGMFLDGGGGGIVTAYPGKTGVRGRGEKVWGRGAPPPERYDGSEAFAFPFFLTGSAQADAGEGFQTFLGNGFAALATTGLTVDPFGAFPVLGRTGALEGRLACEAFQFLRLIKNVHSCPRSLS